jgi:hypothetical protein
MNNKVIPLPAPAAPATPTRPGVSSRFIVSVGKQRIAFDVACRATVLRTAPAKIVVLPKPAEEKRDGNKK